MHKITDVGHLNILKSVVKELSCDDSRGHRFPGPNPVSLDTSHFSLLKSEAYYVCEKTDGVRMLLVCYVVGPLKVVALVDRALTAYVLPLQRVPKAMFQGTLLDGELAWNKVDREWDYQVFDAMCVSGVPVLDLPLPLRMGAAHRALGTYAHTPHKDPVRLRLKSFVSSSRIGDLEAHLAGARRTYDIDGVVLTPMRAPVMYGRHLGMFKLKFGERHTVDFLVDSDGKGLSVFEGGKHVVVGALRKEVRSTPGAIVECAQVSPGVWDVVGVRTDKTTANDMLTYQKTLLNMREKLTLDDVVRAFGA